MLIDNRRNARIAKARTLRGLLALNNGPDFATWARAKVAKMRNGCTLHETGIPFGGITYHTGF